MSESELFIKLKDIRTEQININSSNIDTKSVSEILYIINSEDALVHKAVNLVIPEIEIAVNYVINSLKNNGRLIYVGAGTSGRLAIVDAAECPPTFGTDKNMVQALIAGGRQAVFQAQEGAEDNEDNVKLELQVLNLNQNDTLCGIAASGRTPYIKGALDYANSIGCKTVLVTTAAKDTLELFNLYADVIINPNVGPEVIAGSTRMKSGTAQKLILNMITTAAMIRLGKTYSNIMVDLQLTNEKLKERAKKIIMNFTGVDYDKASEYLTKSKGHVKSALVMILGNTDYDNAQSFLEQSDGFVRNAIELATKQSEK